MIDQATDEALKEYLARRAAQTCRICGCTDADPCVMNVCETFGPDEDDEEKRHANAEAVEPETCAWVTPNLCSACATAAFNFARSVARGQTWAQVIAGLHAEAERILADNMGRTATR